MVGTAVVAGLRRSLMVCTPPYRSARSLPGSGGGHELLTEPGTIILAPLSARTRPEALGDLARDFRKKRPHLVLGAMQLGGAMRPPFSLVTTLPGLGFRFCLHESFPLFGLATLLADLGIQRSDFHLWLDQVLAPGTLREVGVVVALSHYTAEGFYSQLDRRSVSRWTHKLGLKPPRSWITLGRLLRALNSLQGETHLTIEEAAHRARYSSAANFTHACQRYFGMAPSDIRGRLGWEWLACRFLGKG